MRTAYIKDVIRTILRENKRFFAIIIIIILGVTMFSGLKAACEDLRKSADAFYDSQGLHDLYIVSTLGLTDGDVEALLNVEGIEEAEGIYTETVEVELSDRTFNITMRTLSEKGIDEPYITQGRLPESADEAVVTQEFLSESGLSLGDTFTISETLDEGDEDTEAEDPTFSNTEYTITGVAVDVTSIDNAEESTAYRSKGISYPTVFVLPEAADSEIYTAVCVSLEGAAEMYCYGDEYEKLVESVKSYIEDRIKTQREEARYEQVVDAAEQELNESLAEAEEELNEAGQELEDGREEIEEGEAELDEAEQKLNESEDEAEAAFDVAWAQIEESRSELNSGIAQYEDGVRQISEAQAELESGKEELAQQEEAALAQLDEQANELNENLAEIEASEREIKTQREAIAALLGEYWPQTEYSALVEASGSDTEGTGESYAAALAALMSKLESLSEDIKAVLGENIYRIPELAVAEGLLSNSRSQIEAGFAQIEQAREEAEAGFALAWAQIAEQQAIIDESRQTLEESYAQLIAGIDELESAIAQLSEQEADSRAQIAEARLEIEENRQTLAEAKEELSEAFEEYEEGLAELESEEIEARAEIEDIDMAEWYIQDRSFLNGYENVSNDAASIETIGTVFPIVFFIVAMLITLNAVSRMVEEDRSCIGTYMALGFTPVEARQKYIFYTLTAGILGSFAGSICAFIVLPNILFKIFRTMYLIPEYVYTFVPLEGIFGPIVFITGIQIATEMACNKNMAQMPATLMRPMAPHAGTRIFLENMRAIWSRLSFLQKVTARNLFRYKKRLMMTVCGIAGCTALLLFGFSIKDSVADLMPLQYGEIFSYDVMATVSAQDNEQLLSYLEGDELVEEYMNAEITTATLSDANEENITLTLVVIPDGFDISSYVSFYDAEGEQLVLEDGEVFVTYNAGSVLGFSEGDKLSLQLTDLQQADIVLSNIIQNYLGNYIYMTQETFEQYFDKYEPNGVLIKLSEACEDQNEYTEELKAQDGILSCTGTQELLEDFTDSFELINMVVYVVIAMSAALAFVVLFTLQTTNISEREREIATIKVLGFYDREVHLYIDVETYILVAVGILIGLPVGYGFSRMLSSLLNMPSIYLPSSLHTISYIYAILLGAAFTIIVNLITDRLLDSIDPAKALKSVE